MVKHTKKGILLKASVLVLAPLLLCLSVGLWFHFERAEPDEDFSTLLAVAESLTSAPAGPATPIGAVPFLRRHLGRAPGMSPIGSFAIYHGVRGEHHHMVVNYCNIVSPFGLMRDGAYVTKHYRCATDELPAGFPDDLADTLARVQEDSSDKQLIVDDAIEKYLQKAGKLSPEAQRELAFTAQARRDRLAPQNKAASKPAATVNE